MLSHQKLKVYSKSLTIVASLATHSAAWDNRHAVIDQLCRASECIVLNIAEAARLHSLCHKQQVLDYATGSALECAACVDIAVVKRFLLPELAARQESRLYRQVDKAATSMILNIAEGYGRSGEGDRLKFLEIAEASAVKAAAFLDLCASKAELDPERRHPGIDFLGRVVLMLRALSGSRSE